MRARKPVISRFMAKVDFCGPESHLGTPCWQWTASTDGRYGVFWADRKVKAHRVSYEIHVGPVPEGLMLDHLCRNTRCVNPEHLEPVTRSENARRGLTGLHTVIRRALTGTCPHGHPFDQANTRVNKRGARCCRTCARLATRAYRARLLSQPTNQQHTGEPNGNHYR